MSSGSAQSGKTGMSGGPMTSSFGSQVVLPASVLDVLSVPEDSLVPAVEDVSADDVSVDDVSAVVAPVDDVEVPTFPGPHAASDIDNATVHNKRPRVCARTSN